MGKDQKKPHQLDGSEGQGERERRSKLVLRDRAKRSLTGEYIKFELDLVDQAKGGEKDLYFHYY